MINSERLRAFVVFAERMNFTHAAQELHVSQPALHVQIRKLAEALGAPLYIREGRALRLTVEGRKLLAFGREQQERSDAFVDDLRGSSHADVVTLAAGEGTFLYLLGDAIRAFRSATRSKLRVLTRDRDQALQALQLGEAQLAVTVIDEIPAGIVARPVLRAGSAVVLPRAHPLAAKRVVSIADLDGEPLIAPGVGRPARSALARAWSDAGLVFTPAVEANGWELMLHFARLGLGVAIVNDFCRAPAGTVMRRLRGLPTLHYQLLRLRGRAQSEASSALERAILGTV
jgi:DNA-binding transcriptional LysR family regulator